VGISHGAITTHRARSVDPAGMRELRDRRTTVQVRYDVDPESELLNALWIFALLGQPQEDLLEEYLDAWPLEFRARAQA
jgi:hypothetical protein